GDRRNGPFRRCGQADRVRTVIQTGDPTPEGGPAAMTTDVLTTDRPAPSTARDTLAAVQELAPTIVARAGEVEAARRLPPDLLDQLVAAGCFRLLLPTSHGGQGADLLSALEVLETLARADASVGWTVMIGAGSWIDLAGLPRATFDSLYADGPDAITAG